MSLTYIFGGAGTGKTRYCLDDMLQKQDIKGGGNLIYIVPEQFSLQSEKSMVDKTMNKAMLEVQILSFNRLSYRVFSETGYTKRKLLDDTGKNMLLRRIIYNIGGELTFFNKSIDKKGFIDNLSRLITEFYQYNIPPETLADYALNPLVKQTLSLKLQDLYKIYDCYTRYIMEQYIADDEALDLLAEKIQYSKYLNEAHIWIDGFYGFTPQEYKVIEKLLLQAANVTIALTIREAKTDYRFIVDSDPFHESKDTIHRLTFLAGNVGAVINKPIFLPSDNRFGVSQEISHFEKYFFSTERREYQGEVEAISIVPALNIYEEVKTLADGIVGLVRDRGLRYRDIGVITNSLETYSKIIKGVFSQYKIPVFVDTRTDILSHPLTELIRAAVEVVVRDWSYEGVFRFLKTEMTGIDRDNIFDLENYCLAYGIKSYKWHFIQWKWGFESGGYDEESIVSCRDDVLAALKPFTASLKADSAITVRELAERMYNLLSGLNVATVLTMWIDRAMLSNDNELLRRHKQIWGRICHVFDKMVEILGDERVTVREFAKILDAGLMGCDMGIIPPSQEQIIIGDLERSRLPHIRALFVLGVNEGVLPAITVEKGIFTDDDRISLGQNGLEIKSGRIGQMLKENLTIYSQLTKPSDYLILSYSYGSLSGKSINPSSIISKIKKMFPKLIERVTEPEFIGMPASVLEKLGTVLRSYKSGNSMNDVFKDIYGWFLANEYYRQRLLKMKSLLFNQDFDEKLSPETVEKLYGNEVVTSVSRLEKYVQCPFAYFVMYNLQAEERKAYQVDFMDLGNVFHDILEAFTKTVVARGSKWNEITADDIDVMVDECIDGLELSLNRDVFFSTAGYRYILMRIKRVSKKSIWALTEHMKMGDFQTFGTELTFTSQVPLTEIVIESGSKRFVLTGRIDRVDVMDLNGVRYVKIIDYKSGGKRLNITDIFYGMQLQLMLYLDTLIKNKNLFFPGDIDMEVRPGGVFYFHINDPVLDASKFSYDIVNPYENINAKILDEFKLSGLVLSDTDIVKAMDRNMDSWSQVISNVQMSSNTGTGFSRNSSVLDLEGFSSLCNYTTDKIREIGNEILNGRITPAPYKKGLESGCRYCGYNAVCQFDTIDQFDKYRKLSNFRNITEVLEKIITNYS